MKILQANNYLKRGGAEVVFVETTRLLTNAGYTVASFTAEDAPKSQSAAHEAFRYIYSVAAKRSLAKKLAAFEPDIIHLHGFYNPLSPSVLSAVGAYKRLAASRGKTVRVVMTPHDYHLLCPNTGFVRYDNAGVHICEKCGTGQNYHVFLNNCDRNGWLYSTLKGVRSVLNYNILNLQREIDFFIAPSHFMKAKLVAGGFDANKIETVHNPVFKYDALTAMFNASQDETKKYDLVFLGRLSPEKGVAELLERIAASKKNYTLAIVGEGEETSALKQGCKKLGLTHLVSFLGYQPQDVAFRLLQQCRTLVLPSVWYENNPLVVGEALVLGLNVALNPIGGMAELVSLFPERIQTIDDLFSSEHLMPVKSDASPAHSANWDILNPTQYLEKVLACYHKTLITA